MAELKECDIQLLEDRIKNMNVGLLGMGEKETMSVNKAFLTSVRDYMAELLELNRRPAPENWPEWKKVAYNEMFAEGHPHVKPMTVAPENKALTLDELRQMDGEPVWVRLRLEPHGFRKEPKIAKFWAIVCGELLQGSKYTVDFGGGPLASHPLFEAYRRKPEEDAK